MNQFLIDNSLAIILALILFIFILMGALILILFKLLLFKNPASSSEKSSQPETKPSSYKDKYVPEKIVEQETCIHHKDAPAIGSCLICEEVFCVDCVVDHESMHFCKEHFRIFANNKWKQITDVRTTPDTPEAGLFIYHFKRDLWQNKNIPTFVMTHYKINIENDFIESFVQLNVREEDVEKLSLEIQKYKAQD